MLSETYIIGTGNSQSTVDKREMLRLQNVEITQDEINSFLNYLYDLGEENIEVKLSNRKTKYRWGTAWGFKRRVILYRHSVWCFLHEIAHVLNYSQNKKKKSHGKEFGSWLDLMYEIWTEEFEFEAEIWDIAATKERRN